MRTRLVLAIKWVRIFDVVFRVNKLYTRKAFKNIILTPQVHCYQLLRNVYLPVGRFFFFLFFITFKVHIVVDTRF
jgi:hypothetical protein